MSVINLLTSNGYMLLNKELLHKFGPTAAIIMGELCEEYAYWESAGELTEDGFFFSTIDNVEKETRYGERAQRSALKELEEAGLVSVTVKGMPQKRHIRINEDALISCICGNQSLHRAGQKPCAAQTLTPAPRRTNNNNNNNNKNNNKESKLPSTDPCGCGHLPSMIRNPDYAEISAEYKRQFGVQPMGGTADQLNADLDATCRDAVIYAIGEANRVNARVPGAYIHRILENLAGAGIKSNAEMAIYLEHTGRSKAPEKTDEIPEGWDAVAEWERLHPKKEEENE